MNLFRRIASAPLRAVSFVSVGCHAIAIRIGLTVLAGTACLATGGVQASETVYYSFPKSAANPATVGPSGLSLGPDSYHFYGTTRFGGIHDAGTVFRFNQTVAPGPNSVQTLYSFGASATDGRQPAGGVVLDDNENVYGVTSEGGAYGYGTLFKIDGNGTETILHSFGGTSDDGRTPNAGLVISGNDIIGSTSAGGPNAASGATGSVFRYAINTAAYATGATGGGATAGTMPLGNLLFTPDGHLFGTTYEGGDSGYGTLFAQPVFGGGSTAPSTVLSFASSTANGAHPNYSLIGGAINSNLYFGIVAFGGAYGAGGVFKYDASAGAVAPLSMLYSAGQQAIDGKKVTSLILATDGNFYGTTADGGQYASATDAGGSLFRLSPDGVKTIVYSFGASATDGVQPAQPLFIFPQSEPATFYGTTNGGGANGAGTIYAYVLDGAPATPTNLVAHGGQDDVNLSWPRSFGATSYSIYESTSPGAERLVSTSNSSTVTLSGLTPGTAYYFKVSATNSAGTSALSAEQSATPLPPAPAAPQGLIASPTASGVVLTWDPSATATGYRVYMSTASGHETSNPPVASPTGTQALISGLSVGTTYYFEVIAVNAGGSSFFSAEVHAAPVTSQPPAPVAPTGVVAADGDGHVYLTWRATANAAGYKVFMSTAAGGENLSGASAAVDTSNQATVNGLNNGTVYYFKVVAVNASGSSPASAEVDARPHPASPPPPPAPSVYSAAPASGQVTLSWSSPQGASYYKVFVGTQKGGNYYGVGATAAVQTSATTVTIASLSNGTTYYFRVVPYTSANVAGTPSNEVSATPMAPPPAPTHVLASAGDQHIYLSWTGSAAANGYQVFISTTPGGENLSGSPATEVASTQALINGLVDGTTYYFKIVAVGVGGSSPPSNEVHAAPM